MKKGSIIVYLSTLLILTCQSVEIKEPNLKPKNEKQIFADLDELTKYISKQLIESYTKYLDPQKTSKKKLAVLIAANADGAKSELGRSISNSLQPKMFDPSLFSLLERERVDSILSQFEFNSTGLVKSQDTKELGKMLGADLLVVGTINHGNEEFSIRLRVVDIETSEIVGISEGHLSHLFFEKYKQIIVPEKKTIKGAYALSFEFIRIAEKKPEKLFWDAGDFPTAYPDIVIRISINNVFKFETSDCRDTLECNFKDVEYLTKELKVIGNTLLFEEFDSINIEVFDRDILVDDPIGKFNLQPNKILELINKEKMEFQFNSVEKLVIRINKV